MSTLLLLILMCVTYGWSGFHTFFEGVGFVVVAACTIIYDVLWIDALRITLRERWRRSEPKATAP